MRLAALALGLALATVVSGAASAVTMTATYKGTVSSSWDQANLFGAGTDLGALNGLAFTARFVYDTATPGSIRETTPTSDTIYGGSDVGVSSPMRSSSLTINKHRAVVVDPSSLAGVFANGNLLQHNSVFVSEDKSGQIQASGQRFDSSIFPTNVESSFQLTSRKRFGEGYFTFNEVGFEGSVAGTLALHSVRIAPVTLPTTLPLLAGGIAILGFLGLKQRREAVCV
jgi:hypothetical protein